MGGRLPTRETLACAEPHTPPFGKAKRNPARHVPVPSGPSPDLASFLSEDCALEVFGKLSDSLVLRRLVATCRIWQRLLRCGPNTPAKALWDQAWLPVSGANAPRVLKHAPVGERIRILSGATLRGQIVCGHALHVKAEPGVKLTGCLYLQGGACGSAASREEEAIPAHLFGGLEQQREGVIEGLCFEHYMDAAVFVRGGSWHLTNCHITSSRRNNRSVTAIQIRENGCLRLDACTVTRAAHACEIDRGWCTLVCNDCTFSDTKAAVITRGGGCVVIERSTFSGNDQALKLDDLVHVSHCAPAQCAAMHPCARVRACTACMHPCMRPCMRPCNAFVLPSHSRLPSCISRLMRSRTRPPSPLADARLAG